jgi:hypothetical protein
VPRLARRRPARHSAIGAWTSALVALVPPVMVLGWTLAATSGTGFA